MLALKWTDGAAVGERLPAIADADYMAALVGVSPTYMRRLCRDGRVPAAKVGREWRVNVVGALRSLGLADAYGEVAPHGGD